MVADLKSLSESLRQSTPEVYLRQIIRARKSEIEGALNSGKSFVLRVPDGRRIRISRRATSTGSTLGVAE